MQLTGSYTFKAPRETVWRAMLDPENIRRCMPGCEEFKTTGDGQYEAVMKAGVGSIKGTFQGKIQLSERQEPSSYRMGVEGGGKPGRVKGSGVLTLTDQGAATLVSYDGDAQVAGLIASVGQRLLGITAKKMIEQFFKTMEKQIPAAGA
ncbi:MAG TPA: carbon monoxide dehydrogenase subunit G [Dehalococcoidia bacterium]